MVDMRDDGEIADVRNRNGGHGARDSTCAIVGKVESGLAPVKCPKIIVLARFLAAKSGRLLPKARRWRRGGPMAGGAVTHATQIPLAGTTPYVMAHDRSPFPPCRDALAASGA